MSSNYQQNKTHCPKGHAYTGKRDKRGFRRCDICLERQRDSYMVIKSEGLAKRIRSYAKAAGMNVVDYLNEIFPEVLR